MPAVPMLAFPRRSSNPGVRAIRKADQKIFSQTIAHVRTSSDATHGRAGHDAGGVRVALMVGADVTVSELRLATQAAVALRAIAGAL